MVTTKIGNQCVIPFPAEMQCIAAVQTVCYHSMQRSKTCYTSATWSSQKHVTLPPPGAVKNMLHFHHLEQSKTCYTSTTWSSHIFCVLTFCPHCCCTTAVTLLHCYCTTCMESHLWAPFVSASQGQMEVKLFCTLQLVKAVVSAVMIVLN